MIFLVFHARKKKIYGFLHRYFSNIKKKNQYVNFLL